AALGFAEFDITRAWRELETLFAGQWDDGMVPHIIFHKPDPGYFPGPDVWQGRGPIPSSGVTQPPVAATMARKVYEKDPEFGRAQMRSLFPKMLAWHRWFMAWRLDQGAVCITHPWESGRDNATDWDGAMAALDPAGVADYTRRDLTHVDADMRPTKWDYDRYIWLVQMGRGTGWDHAKIMADKPFRVADPTMTFTLLRAQRDLAWMAKELDLYAPEIDEWITKLEAGAETLWNPEAGHYDSRDVNSGEFAGSLSNASMLCWYAGLSNPKMDAPLEHMLGAARYGVPSYDPKGPIFDAKRYWRGPVWAIMNTMIGWGLADASHPAAEIVRKMTRDLISQFSFAEYYDPRDGSPAGGETFTWTAAVWLAWAGKEV
ncbi:MAG: hypothetical protein AAF679_06685, partial [Pseudomonadota bacterium]